MYPIAVLLTCRGSWLVVELDLTGDAVEGLFRAGGMEVEWATNDKGLRVPCPFVPEPDVDIEGWEGVQYC